MLTREQLDAARAAAHEWAGRRGSAAFGIASGSLVEGYGNRLSDIDAYLVGDGPEFDGREEHIARGSVKIELTLLSTRSIEARFDRCFGRGASPRSSIDGYDALLAHRFLTATALFNEAAFHAFMASNDKNLLSARLADYCSEASVDAFQDFVGIAQSGDHASGAVAAKRASDCGIDMVLALAGDTNPVSKWRLKRLAKFGLQFPDIAADYLSVVFPFGKPHLTDEIDFANASTRVFHACHERRVRLGIELPPSPAFPEIKRHPLCYLRAKGDTIFLVCPGTAFRIGPSLAAQFLSQPLAKLDAASFQFSPQSRMGAGDDVPPQLRELVARGVLIGGDKGLDINKHSSSC
jgi:hypothetical protein